MNCLRLIICSEIMIIKGFLMKLFVIFLLLSINVSAQKLEYIPDVNLRNELTRLGFTVNDSLDIQKIEGKVSLKLSGKKIENIEGLQHFKQLRYLFIENNKISKIEILPESLEQLFCDTNKISLIINLPKTLKFLSFGNNQMTYLPELPKSLEFLNYRNNPIRIDILPVQFQNINCNSLFQNCLPNTIVNWHLLNSTIKSKPEKISGMKIVLNAKYSWGQGKQVETLDFKLDGSTLFADRPKIVRTKDNKDSVFFNDILYSFDESQVAQIINDIYLNKMIVQIPDGDSLVTIDMSNKINESTCFNNCSDCTEYELEYFIYTKSDTIHLSYNFDNSLNRGIVLCEMEGSANIKLILDWLYIYKLINVTIPYHKIANSIFNKPNLDRIADWAK